MFKRSSSATSRPTEPVERPRNATDRGVAIVALLASCTIMLIGLGVAGESWGYIKRRNDEEELLWRGFEIVKAIQRYRAVNGGSAPPNMKALYGDGRNGILRKEMSKGKAYEDPITRGDWRLITEAELLTLTYCAPVGAQAGQPPPDNPFPTQTPPPTPSRTPPTRGGATLVVDPDAVVRAGLGAPDLAALFMPLLAAGPGVPGGPGGGGAGSPGGPGGPGSPTPGLPGWEAEGIQQQFIGVRSKSTAESFGVFNGQNRYDRWCFVGGQNPTIPNEVVAFWQIKEQLMRVPKDRRPKFTGAGKKLREWGSPSSRGGPGDRAPVEVPPDALTEPVIP